MDFESLPSIDWDHAIKLAGNQQNLAEEIHAHILRDLPENIAKFKSLNTEQNYLELTRQVHKLHGALCYTGFIRLKNLIKTLETQLKNNIMDNSQLLIDEVEFEYNQLLKLSKSASAKSNSSTNA